MNLQARYDLEVARDRLSARLQREVKPANFPALQIAAVKQRSSPAGLDPNANSVTLRLAGHLPVPLAAPGRR